MKNEKHEIEFLDDCLLIDKEILVLGDLHMGWEEYVAEKNIFSGTQLKTIINKLEKVFLFLEKQNINLKKIIILGDLKHEFGGISDSEWGDVIKFLNFIEKKREEIVIIKGNHDNILEPIAKKKNIKLKNYYRIKDVCFLHGHKMFKECLNNSEIKILIMSHLHPAITLSDKYKKEKYKCFLKGKWDKKQVYILPSFSPVSFGYNLNDLKNKDDKKGFLIIDNKSLKNFQIIIYNEKENRGYNFGELKRLGN